VKGEELKSTITPPVVEDKVQPFQVPDWAADPFYVGAHLEVFKNDAKIETLPLGAKKYTVFGRNDEVCDVVIDHPSASRKHAAIVHHTSGKVYLIDLQSGHGTFVDDTRLKPHTPISLKEGTTIRFGASSRVYIASGVGEDKDKDKDKKRKDAPLEKRKTETESTLTRKLRKFDSEPKSVRCRHLLVKHTGSRNPSSWKQPKITRKKEEAIWMIKKFRDQIVSGDKDFAELAMIESDCSSAKHGGDLKHFTRGQMQKPFEDVSFVLEVGSISGIVETDSGVHIIQRTE